MRLWKTLTTEMKSFWGDESPWELGKWKKISGPVKVYERGFHASKNIIDAMRNFNPGLICEVEVRGKHDQIYDDTEAWSTMRVLRVWGWRQKDNVDLAIFAAELAIDIFEKAFPGDDRPRRAIEAAKAWLISSIERNRQAAEKAAEAANEAAWMAASKFDDKKFDGAFEAALAARDAARTAAYEELATKYALDAEIAAEIAIAKVLAADETLEQWQKVRREIRDKCHSFVLRRLKAVY